MVKTCRQWALQELNLRPHAYQAENALARVAQIAHAIYRCVSGALSLMGNPFPPNGSYWTEQNGASATSHADGAK